MQIRLDIGMMFYCKIYQFFVFGFFDRNEYLIFQKVVKLEYDFPDGFNEVGKSFVQSLLVSDIFSNQSIL